MHACAYMCALVCIVYDHVGGTKIKEECLVSCLSLSTLFPETELLTDSRACGNKVCAGCFCFVLLIKLTQTGVTWEKGPSTGKHLHHIGKEANWWGVSS